MIKCFLFGHKLKITKSKSYKKRCLECIRCKKQFSGAKDSCIEESLWYCQGKRFIIFETDKDNQLNRTLKVQNK